jgi:hypothetical protein
MSGSNSSERLMQRQDIEDAVDMFDLGDSEAAAFSMINASQRTPGRTSEEHIIYHANDNGTGPADLARAQGVFKGRRDGGRASPLSMRRPGQH